MDLFYDPDDPKLCDRDSAVKYYKDQLIEAYKNRDKLFAKKQYIQQLMLRKNFRCQKLKGSAAARKPQ